MQGYAVKRVPKMIRGIIMSLIGVFAACGTILYLQVQKIFFKEHPNMVFGTLAIFDVVILILIAVSIAFGWYGDPPKKQGADDDSNAADRPTNLEDVGFTDEFPEVPFAKDLYDEAVPEVSEYREQSMYPHSIMEEDFEGTFRDRKSKYRDTLRNSKRAGEERSKILGTFVTDDNMGSFDEGSQVMTHFSRSRT